MHICTSALAHAQHHVMLVQAALLTHKLLAMAENGPPLAVWLLQCGPGFLGHCGQTSFCTLSIMSVSSVVSTMKFWTCKAT